MSFLNYPIFGIIQYKQGMGLYVIFIMASVGIYKFIENSGKLYS